MRYALLFLTSVGCLASVGGGTFGRPPPATASPKPAQVQEPAEAHTHTAGWITADQVRSLIGKPISEAKRLLLSWGQTGDIIVSDDAYAGCGIGVVCDVNHIVMHELAGKIDPRNRIFLGTNKVAALTAPPPE